jgi:hypothetical protein
MDRLDEARRELNERTREQIEEETAYKWAARAVAAYENHVRAPSDATTWLLDADSYMHEAIEHAALADRTGDVLWNVRRWVRQCGAAPLVT